MRDSTGLLAWTSSWGAIATAVCLSACSPSDEVAFERKIGALKRVETKETPPRLFASSAERFGLATPGSASASAFEYTTPDGWNEVAPTDLRAINFTLGDSECYVTVLGGDGGGTLANVNRWCGQIGARSWTQKELDAAPRIPMFGADAVIVALGNDESERMVLGAMARLESRVVFVKLTGPRAEVLNQRDAFEAFCTSLSKQP